MQYNRLKRKMDIDQQFIPRSKRKRSHYSSRISTVMSRLSPSYVNLHMLIEDMSCWGEKPFEINYKSMRLRPKFYPKRTTKILTHQDT